MPKRKTEAARPKVAEIVSFADLKARRDAKRADVWATIHVISGLGKPGDVVLCETEDGGLTLERIVSCDGEDWNVTNLGGHRLASVFGAVVLVSGLEEA